MCTRLRLKTYLIILAQTAVFYKQASNEFKFYLTSRILFLILLYAATCKLYVGQLIYLFKTFVNRNDRFSLSVSKKQKNVYLAQFYFLSIIQYLEHYINISDYYVFVPNLF